MQLQFKTITPEHASDLLANHNPSNRRLDNRHAAFLAREMDRGTFRPDNGDTIRIDTDGNVLDGQHRLAAVVRIGKPVDMLVAYDVDRDAFSTVDIGKPRTVQDIVAIDLARRGIVAPKGATTSARLMLEYESRFSSGASSVRSARGAMMPVDAVQSVCVRAGFIETVERASKLSKQLPTVNTAPIAVALTVCELDDRKACDAFFHRLRTMEGLRHGAPEHSVDRALRAWKMNGTALQRSAYGQLFALLRGYIASRDGQRLSKICVPPSPESFPYLPTTWEPQ